MDSFVEDRKTFKNNLDAVQKIINYASERSDSEVEDILKGLAIVKLTTAIEVFFESVVETFDDQLKTSQIKNKHVPQLIKQHILKHKINDTIIAQIKNGKENALETIHFISSLWVPTNRYAGGIDASFNYGQHGSGEVDRLFKRIGIDDIFSLTTDLEEDSDSLIDQKEVVSPKGLIDSITNYRNKIIHEGESINLTSDQIQKMTERLFYFTDQFIRILNNHLLKIKEISLDEFE